MYKICDCCKQEKNSFVLLGLTKSERVFNRPPARVCDDCYDTCPCGLKGYWDQGKLTCPHGDTFTVDYVWEIQTYRTKNNSIKLIYVNEK